MLSKIALLDEFRNNIVNNYSVRIDNKASKYSLNVKTFKGNNRYLTISPSSLMENENKIDGSNALITNASENKVIEELESFRAAVEEAGEVIVITDINGYILYANKAFEKLSGYSRNEAIGKNTSINKSGLHTNDFYRELWDCIKSGNVWHGVFKNKRKDGTIYEEHACISPITNQQGDIIRFVAVKRDMTKERELLRQIQQSQKMESLGLFASGIAHDFNNLLTSISGYVEIIERSKDSHKITKTIEKLDNIIGKATLLIKKLLMFSKTSDGLRQPHDINGIIQDLKNVFIKIIKEEVEFTIDLYPDKLLVDCDPVSFEQVFVNLISNASDSIIEQGELFITTNLINETKPLCEICISDTGSGIQPEILDKIYDPFFTTKEVGKGTGLGLSTVFSIIQDHGGTITVQSNIGEGTTFRIRLPLIS